MRWIQAVVGAIVLCTGELPAQTRTVEASIEIAGSPSAAIDAFLTDEGLSGWWAVSRSLVERRVGGVWSISWDDWGEEKTQHAWTGVIETLTPTRVVIGHLVMNEPNRPLFGPLTLEIRATPSGEGSRVTVYHGGYRRGDDWDWMHDTVIAGWDHVLGDLRAWFERGERR